MAELAATLFLLRLEAKPLIQLVLMATCQHSLSLVPQSSFTKYRAVTCYFVPEDWETEDRE